MLSGICRFLRRALPSHPSSRLILYINSPENYFTSIFRIGDPTDRAPLGTGAVGYRLRWQARIIFSGAFLLLAPLFLPVRLLPVFALALFAIYTRSAYLTHMLSVFLLPLAVALGHSAQYLAVSSVLCVLLMPCTGRKAPLTPLDLAVGALGVIYLLMGMLFGFSSFISSLIFFFSLLSYFTASRAVVTPRQTQAFSDMLTLSSSLHSALSLIDFFLHPKIHEQWLDANTSGLFPRLTGAFSNPNILSVYLLIVTLTALATVLKSSGGGRRYCYILAFLLNFLCLLLTYTRGAYIAFIIGALLLILIMRREALRWLFLILPPLLAFGIGNGFIARLLSAFNPADGSVSSRLSLLRSAYFMLKDTLPLGIGVGQTRFCEVYAEYAEGGVFAPHCHNTLLQIALEGGALALIAFIYMLYLLLKLSVSYFSGRSRSHNDCIMSGLISGVLSVLVFSLFDNIFFAPHSVFLFFTVLGVLSSVMTEGCIDESDGYQKNSATECDISIRIRNI
ncbi:MAG: O-antigen ligase family protein [Clostridia bacterium]|nr:O-antigen ligase family protein [Clostridia bacterium]